MNRNLSGQQMLPVDFGPAQEPTKSPARQRGPKPGTGPADLPMFVEARDLVDHTKYSHGDLPTLNEAAEMHRTMYDADPDFGQYDGPGEFRRAMLKESKLRESAVHEDGGSLYSRVAKEGVRAPVSVVVHRNYDEKRLLDGHHRVFSAAEQAEVSGGDKLVPVQYWDWNEAHKAQLAANEQKIAEQGS